MSKHEPAERQVALGVGNIPESMDGRIWTYARRRHLTKASAVRLLLEDALTRAEQDAAATSQPPATARRRRAA